MEPQFIEDVATLAAFLTELPNDLETLRPRFYIDLEGNNLSRAGSLSIVTILVEPRGTTHLIDVTTLGAVAFTTVSKSATPTSLKSILESPTIPKVFFDIRNDSDALFSLHGVSVAGIHDLQLMELASRPFSKKHVNGLSKCVERDAGLSYIDRLAWSRVKNEGKNLFAPECGGSYKVFDERPLPTAMKMYCVQDVTLMPRLYNLYIAKLCDAWWEKISEETVNRIRLSQSVNYNGKGQHKANAPEGWLYWRPTGLGARTRSRLQAIENEELVDGSAETDGSDENTETETAIGPVAAILAQLALKNGYNEGDSDDYEAGEVRFTSTGHGYSSDEPQDFAACDRDCGYCGRCSY